MPPPFLLVITVVDAIHHHLSTPQTFAVLHCKAGKGRSGSMACAYMIVYCGLSATEARQRFTDRRMKQGRGEGVSMASQKRYLGYVERWAKRLRLYQECLVVLTGITLYGVRAGAHFSLQNYADGGRNKGQVQRDSFRKVHCFPKPICV